MRKQVLLALLALLWVRVSAQVKITDFEVVREGDRAEIAFTAQVNDNAVRSNYKLTITPIVSNNGHSVELDAIIVLGKRRQTMDERNGVGAAAGAFVVRNGQTIEYRSGIAYADWLRGASVDLALRSEGCCWAKELPSCVIAQNITLQGEAGGAKRDYLDVRVDGMVLLIERNAQLLSKEKVQSVEAVVQSKLVELTVDFRAGSALLEPSVKHNRAVLNQLMTTLQTSDKIIDKKVEITGFASPEGVEHENYELAHNRALSVRNCLLEGVPSLGKENFNIINGGENWEGLRRLVEASAMPERGQVIDIIDRTPPRIDYVNNTSRKKYLMDLAGGRVWMYMLREFFPQLRNAASVAIYTVERSVEVPLQEDNAVVITNAIEQIGLRNASAALELLRRVERDPRAWNPMGVCYALLGDVEQAKAYFQKAIDVGYSEAKGNIGQMP